MEVLNKTAEEIIQFMRSGQILSRCTIEPETFDCVIAKGQKDDFYLSVEDRRFEYGCHWTPILIKSIDIPEEIDIEDDPVIVMKITVPGDHPLDRTVIIHLKCMAMYDRYLVNNKRFKIEESDDNDTYYYILDDGLYIGNSEGTIDKKIADNNHFGVLRTDEGIHFMWDTDDDINPFNIYPSIIPSTMDDKYTLKTIPEGHVKTYAKLDNILKKD